MLPVQGRWGQEGGRFNPWSENYILNATTKAQCSKINKYFLKNRVYNIYLEGKKKPRELLKTIRSNCRIHENGRLYTLYIKMSDISLINDSENLVEEAILF